MSSRSLKRHRKLSPPDAGGGVHAGEIDRYAPDYAQACANCGESPTVTGTRGGVVVVDTGLCGPCCWGDARMLDPDTWNE